MVDNPPRDQPLVTLSVQVTDGGDLSISEDVNPKPPCVPEKARARQASRHQSSRSSKQYKRAASSKNRTRVSSRRKPKNEPQHVSSVGLKDNYRIVHFTLGSTRVLKESWFMDGSTQVELKPLGLLGQQVPPVYGCIDSKGELRLSMGNYNQNALGRMASIVAAMGLEENPDTVDQQPKRVVLMGGKTWPTFPVAVTIVDDSETPSQSAEPSKGAPSAVAASLSSVRESERYIDSRLVQQTHNPRPTVQMLQVNPSRVVSPLTPDPTTGVILAQESYGIQTQYQEVPVRSALAPVASKAVVLVAENENNSSSNMTQATHSTKGNKLRKADPDDTRYTSTESLCSIDLADGRLYIAEQTGNSSPLTDSIIGQMPSSKQIQSHEISKTMGQDAHQNQPVLSNMQRQASEIIPKSAGLSAREINHRNNTTVCIHDAVDKIDLPLETDTVEKNSDPLHTSRLSDAPSDIGGKSALNAPPGTSSGPGADSMDEFLKYLQHLNTVMETVMAGGTGEPMPE